MLVIEERRRRPGILSPILYSPTAVQLPSKTVSSMTLYICFFFFHFSVVMIGYDAAAYRVTETDRTISRPVSVSVQSGSLSRNVVVTVQTMDGSATGGRSSD